MARRRLRAVAAHVMAPASAAVQQFAPSSGADAPLGPSEQTFAELRDNGITVVENAVNEQLLPKLRDAAKELVARARAREERGGFVMRSSPEAGPWGHRGIYDPAHGAAAAVFAEYMASPEVLAYAKAFLGCEEDQLMLPDTDFVIFCNPPEGYTQGWHRCARRPSLAQKPELDI